MTSRLTPVGSCGGAEAVLADMLELLLDLARRAPHGPAHEVADRDMRRYLDEHMDVIARQRAVDDRHAHFRAQLPDDLAHSEADLAMQHFVPVLRCPDEMMR